MRTNQTDENHLSKDELLKILNEIDTEQQYDRQNADDHREEKVPPYTHPNPNNQFY